MTDWKAEYERLAEAARAAHTRLVATRWHPNGDLSAWTETAEGRNHGCVIDALVTLERVLNPCPNCDISHEEAREDARKHCPTCEGTGVDPDPELGRRERALSAAGESMKPETCLDCMGTGHDHRDGGPCKTTCPFTTERATGWANRVVEKQRSFDAAEAAFARRRDFGLEHNDATVNNAAARDADAAEREHCLNVAAEISAISRGYGNGTKCSVDCILEARADAARVATERERARCLAVAPKPGTPWGNWIVEWRERIASGEPAK